MSVTPITPETPTLEAFLDEACSAEITAQSAGQQTEYSAALKELGLQGDAHAQQDYHSISLFVLGQLQALRKTDNYALMMPGQQQLARFYNVRSTDALIAALYVHTTNLRKELERLQADKPRIVVPG